MESPSAAVRNQKESNNSNKPERKGTKKFLTNFFTFSKRMQRNFNVYVHPLPSASALSGSVDAMFSHMQSVTMSYPAETPQEALLAFLKEKESNATDKQIFKGDTKLTDELLKGCKYIALLKSEDERNLRASIAQVEYVDRGWWYPCMRFSKYTQQFLVTIAVGVPTPLQKQENKVIS